MTQNYNKREDQLALAEIQFTLNKTQMHLVINAQEPSMHGQYSARNINKVANQT